MIFKAIRLIGKASTAIWVAKTGYQAYQVGSNAYKAYKKVNGTKTGTQKIIKEVKRVMKK